MILENLTNEEFDELMEQALISYKNGKCISIEEFEEEIKKSI